MMAVMGEIQMHDTLFVVYHLSAFFILVAALLILIVIAHAIQFVQIARLKKQVSKLSRASRNESE
jgi:uncharacterized integral membrane protein